ncbi:hypothetical protein Tco_0675318, partial [Tanacetum coccineum]
TCLLLSVPEPWLLSPSLLLLASRSANAAAMPRSIKAWSGGSGCGGGCCPRGSSFWWHFL